MSVSHDDYDQNVGGVQNVIRNERVNFERMDWVYLHLCPAAPLPILAEPRQAEDFRFSLRLGSDWLGVANASDLVACLTELRNNERSFWLVVHQFLGHAPQVLLELARIATERPIVWIHDYITLCPNYKLLRNDVRFCGAPPVQAAACGVCAYGSDRVEHVPRVRAFFEAVRPAVLAPSEAALELWRRGNLAHQEAHVQPYARLVLAPDPLKSTLTEKTRPLRVAYLAMPVLPKGWLVFEELARRFVGSPAYEFYQLGLSYGAALPGYIKNVQVLVNREKPDAMVEAIAEHRIDVVVSWQLWPETFCFAVYEALAGGAFVLARRDAGNVADAIVRNAPEQGHVLESEERLFELFEEGHLKTMVEAANRRYGVLLPESGSATWLRQISRSGKLPPEPQDISLAFSNV
jgi:hypothetical protein